MIFAIGCGEFRFAVFDVQRFWISVIGYGEFRFTTFTYRRIGIRRTRFSEVPFQPDKPKHQSLLL